MSGTTYHFGVGGGSLFDYILNIDTSNKVDEAPIYYWVDQRDKLIPSDTGFVGVVNSTNITVRDITLTKNREGMLFAYTKDSRIECVTANSNVYGIGMSYSSNNTIKNNIASNKWECIGMFYSSNNKIENNTVNLNSWEGIYLWNSSNNTLKNNNASNNEHGIFLGSSSNNNTVQENTVNSNNYTGICLKYSSNNTIYHNNHINNIGDNACDKYGTNTWDSGSVGNHYSDHTALTRTATASVKTHTRSPATAWTIIRSCSRGPPQRRKATSTATTKSPPQMSQSRLHSQPAVPPRAMPQRSPPRT